MSVCLGHHLRTKERLARSMLHVHNWQHALVAVESPVPKTSMPSLLQLLGAKLAASLSLQERGQPGRIWRGRSENSQLTWLEESKPVKAKSTGSGWGSWGSGVSLPRERIDLTARAQLAVHFCPGFPGGTEKISNPTLGKQIRYDTGG